MRRWSKTAKEMIEGSPELEQFMASYRALCRTHGFAFGHEDKHGAFTVEPVTDDLLDWANAAQLDKGAR